MFTHVARARCSDAFLHVFTLVRLTALLKSIQLARRNHPSTFPTHVDWYMYASMSGIRMPTHTNDDPRHPTARTKLRGGNEEIDNLLWGLAVALS